MVTFPLLYTVTKTEMLSLWLGETYIDAVLRENGFHRDNTACISHIVIDQPAKIGISWEQLYLPHPSVPQVRRRVQV